MEPGILLCPFCGHELKEKVEGGWNCRCGEFVPQGYAKESANCKCDSCNIVNVCPIKRLGGDPLRKEFGVM